MPVVELDGTPIGRGPAADELQAALRRPPGYARSNEQQDSPRRHGARQRSARPRADLLGVRDPDRLGEIKVAPPQAAARVADPATLPAGPLRLAESFAVIPELRRKLPEARLPSSARPCWQRRSRAR
jgi:hypothetical protein